MLSAVQKLFGYNKKAKTSHADDTNHFIDLYWKFLNDMDGSKSDYDRQLEDLSNYHRIMKTFVRNQSMESSSELMEALNAEESCLKVAKWLQDCAKVAPEAEEEEIRKVGGRKTRETGERKIREPAAIIEHQVKNSVHYACVRVPSFDSHIYAEIDQQPQQQQRGVMCHDETQQPSRDVNRRRSRSKSFVNNKPSRSQSCKRSNSFLHLGPQLQETTSISQPPKSKSSAQLQKANDLKGQRSCGGSSDLQGHSSGCDIRGHQVERRPRAASVHRGGKCYREAVQRSNGDLSKKKEGARRSRLDSSSSWEVTRRPRNDDSMWV